MLQQMIGVIIKQIIITATPKVNNTTYEITDDESKWKNVGTGTNTDGSQANLGVYGGKYSWEYDIDINF